MILGNYSLVNDCGIQLSAKGNLFSSDLDAKITLIIKENFDAKNESILW